MYGIVNKGRRRRKRVKEEIKMRDWDKYFRDVPGGMEWRVRRVRREMRERGEKRKEEISRERSEER